MGSALRQLPDADLEAIHHLIRRDALSDLAIAQKAEERGRAAGLKGYSLGRTDHAREMTVSRYRRGREFTRWLRRWESQDADLKRDIDAQKRRFELVASLVRDGDQGGFERVPKALLARVLVAATEMNDADLLEAISGKGPLANAIRLVREFAALEMRSAGEKAADTARDAKLSAEERTRKIREIFGLA